MINFFRRRRRDRIALRALPEVYRVLMTNKPATMSYADACGIVASSCYKLADAMIEARKPQ